MQPHLLVALFGGLAVEGLGNVVSVASKPFLGGGSSLSVAAAFKAPTALMLVAAMMARGLNPAGPAPGAPGGLLSRALGLHEAAPAFWFHDYARALLAPLPKGALLLINYDQQFRAAREFLSRPGRGADPSARVEGAPTGGPRCATCSSARAFGPT